jgi:hypothetical protein
MRAADVTSPDTVSVSLLLRIDRDADWGNL